MPDSGQAGSSTALAASADGRKLAFSLARCAVGTATKIRPAQVVGHIAVLDLGSGKITGRWTYTLSDNYPVDMSLTPDGHLLAFVQLPPNESVPVAKTLRTDAPSGTVDRASTVVGLRSVSSLSVGAALYGCVPGGHWTGHVQTYQLGAYDLATGRRTAVLHTWSEFGTRCWLAPNSAHGHLLVTITTVHLPKPRKPGGYTVHALAIDMRTGRLTPLLTMNTSSASTMIGW